MAKRLAAFTETGRSQHGMGEIRSGARYCGMQSHVLGDPRGDSRCKGATRAMGGARMNAGAFEYVEACLSGKNVAYSVAWDVAAFHQHGPCSQFEELLGGPLLAVQILDVDTSK